MTNRPRVLLKNVWLLLCHYFALLVKGSRFCLTGLVGSLTWQPPHWLVWLGQQSDTGRQWLLAKPTHSLLAGLITLLVATSSILGIWWYGQLPKPVLTHYQVKAPAAPSYDDQGHAKPEPLQIVFDESVAPVDKLGQALQAGVTLSPQLTGEWRWEDDKTLSFYPKTDWLIDTDYSVGLSENALLAKTIELDDYTADFHSPPFTAELKQAEFYQDPTIPTQKQLVATVSFSHPVDSADFADKVRLALPEGLQFLNANDPPVTISYDAYKLNAYLHSAVLSIPKENATLKLTLLKGIRSSLGGNGTAAPLNRDVVVPGLYRLTFDNISMTLVDNERFEPEQVLLVNATAPVSTESLANKVQAWLLPDYPPDASEEERQRPYYWSNDKITSNILAVAEPLALAAQATETPYDTVHGFTFKAPVGRYVYAKINAGAQAFGGYQARQSVGTTVQVQPYPQAVKWLSQGSLLSLTGERKLAYMSRGVNGVKLTIGRLLPKQLHHLVDQNGGGFSQPDLSDHDLNSLVENFDEQRPIAAVELDKPQYDSLDVGRYLQDKTANRRGVFMVKLQAYNSENPDEISAVPADTRFVLVTDLGIIAKNSVGGGQDVFVQSIAGGQPVGDARVDVVGRNGQTVFSQLTDMTGRVNFPPLKQLEREKQPLMYVVSYGEDMSFLPINRDDRQLNLSRFDIGGEDNAVSAKQLAVFAFTDRGIYRPGETAHIGFIARTADWQGQLAGLPLVMEIIDPRGVSVLNKQINLPASGFDSIDFSSEDSSATGSYQANFYLITHNDRSQQIGSVDFKVRDFEPDRMKVKLKLSEQTVTGWLRPEAVQAKLNALQLFGSPAAGRRAEGEMVLSPALPAFARYKAYVFRNQAKPLERLTEALTATTTDADGNVELKLDLQRFAAATYQLSVSGKVFEAASGRSVTAEAAALVSNAPYLVGTKTDGLLKFIPRNAERASHWLAVAPNLDPIAVSGLTLQLIERQYVPVLVKQEDGTYRYESRQKDLVRASKPYSLAAEGAEIALDTTKPGDFALTLKDAADQELNRIDYSVAGPANISRSLERNAELQLTLDKTEYAPGDTIAINIRAPYIGSGLITIERDRVYQHVWFKTDTTSSVQNITLPKDFEGNGYVSVQFVRDANSDEVFMSPLSYGVMPFAVNLDARREPLFFSAEKTIKPGQTLAMRLSTPSPSRAVVFAVDEGILQVAGYKSPDPLGFFFQKRALQVDTTQILDMILPEFQKLINAAAPGGDGDDEDMTGRHLNPFKKKHQPPVAWWSGLIDVGIDGQALHYDVPDSFNGKLHLFVVAVNDGHISVYDSMTEVRGDIILSPNLPTTVAPGDEFQMSVSVFNNSPGGTAAKQPITVTLQPFPGLQVISANPLTVAVAGQQEGVAEFTVKAENQLGPVDLRIQANADGKSSKLMENVSVRPPVPFSTQLTLGRFDSATKTVAPTRQLYLQHRDVTAAVAWSPLLWAQGLGDYLDGYEHACTEQLLSKAMPALVFNQDRHNAGSALAQALQILQARQNDEGGFGLWAASLEVEPLTSIYAVHFLLEAKDHGITVPGELLTKANGWLETLAGADSEGLDGIRNRAYAIYLLTRQGIVTSSYLATLQQELDGVYREQWPKDLAAAYIAASYQLLQQDALAAKILDTVPWSDGKTIANAYSYYDPLIHDAQLLYLRAKHFPNGLTRIPDQVLNQMGEAIADNRYNTLSAAYVTLALDAYATTNANDNPLSISETGAKQAARQLPLTGVRTKTAVISTAATDITFSKSQNLPAFYLLSENGFDRTALAAKDQGLEIARTYTDLAGKPVSQVKIGDEFLVKLAIRSTDRDTASDIAIIDLLPGGIEPVLNSKNTQPETATANGDPEKETESDADNQTEDGADTWQAPLGDSKASTWQPSYMDVRDDRVVLYGSVGRSVGTFVYRVRAANAGLYAIPAPFAEGMYDRKLQARGTEGKLQVVKP
ncbi:alpha-2-macroglobulin [Methylovulum psychrotolerans]|uniref:Alpha-2-macroglobulin n=1 Tax=Methylovulum psychrotolerans TaxID=1704499 RepID=A0A2S5CGA2_9GAMM|nr:alpha-2-macroglobulin [Methylovulum psychrotolerans]POZ49835.1 alpha-2-macroglobulin [Methylovulum psychrotolerans]